MSTEVGIIGAWRWHSLDTGWDISCYYSNHLVDAIRRSIQDRHIAKVMNIQPSFWAVCRPEREGLQGQGVMC
jgi:hypothetical protein